MALGSPNGLEDFAGGGVDQVTALQKGELVPIGPSLLFAGECDQVRLERAKTLGRCRFARMA